MYMQNKIFKIKNVSSLVGFFFFLLCFSTYADQKNITLDFYLSSTCPHCQGADIFLKNIEKNMPWLIVKRHVINQDKAALQSFANQLQHFKSDNFSVPTLFFCDSHWIGFNPSTTPKRLTKALQYCYQSIRADGSYPPEVVAVLRQWGNANQFVIQDLIVNSLPLLVTFSALTDAMNPCSFFSFALFFALLTLYPSHKGRQLKLAATFIISLSFIHYIGQAHIALVAHLQWAHLVAAILGVAWLGFILFYIRTFYTAWGKWLYGLIPVTVWVVQVFQQQCKLNMALVFEQNLAKTDNSAQYLLYHLLYQFVYVLPLICFLVFYFLYRQYKPALFQETFLTRSALLNLLVLATLLIIYPYALSNLLLSLCVFMFCLLAGWMSRNYHG